MRLYHCRLNGLSGHEAGRKLLAQAYRAQTGETLPEILTTDLGKPYFPDSPWHFSITHTKNHAFCILSEKNVGIDAEELDRPIPEKLADRIFSETEQQQYDAAQDKGRAFLTFWVLKEAQAKLTGEGLRIYPNHTHFSLEDPRVTEMEGCLVAVLTEENTIFNRSLRTIPQDGVAISSDGGPVPLNRGFPRQSADWLGMTGMGEALNPDKENPMLFDTHAHMDDRAFDADREILLSSLPSQGLGLVLNPGCSLASSRNVDKLTQRYDYLYGAVGSHPDVADEVNEEVLAEYREILARNPKIKAIGEIGLDYHYEDIPRDIQQKAFRMQMALARELNLPVIVHEREAHEDGMKIVEEFPQVKGVFHCYSGSLEMAKWLTARGWYIGFTGVLTFKNARKAVEVAANIPLDRIVLETDCPYMSPEPFRGKRNDPGKLYRMAEKLAQLWDMPVEEIRAITMENGKRLYRI